MEERKNIDRLSHVNAILSGYRDRNGVALVVTDSRYSVTEIPF